MPTRKHYFNSAVLNSVGDDFCDLDAGGCRLGEAAGDAGAVADGEEVRELSLELAAELKAGSRT